jgi:hypothetical protein
VCHKCGQRVGIYPAGQRALRENPAIKITCFRCMALAPPPDEIQTSGTPDEIWQELLDSEPVSET